MTSAQLNKIISLCFRSKREAAEHIAGSTGRTSFCPRNFSHYDDGRPVPEYVCKVMGDSLINHKLEVDALAKSVKM